MSGFEVAGIVLAVIPICSAMLSEYATVESAVKRFKRWRLLLEDCERQLRRHDAHLELTVKIIFLPAIPMAEVKQMLRDYDHPSWKDNVVLEKIKAKHGIMYALFQEGLEEIMGCFKKLVHRLGLANSEEISTAEFRSLVAKHAQSDRSRHILDRVNFVRRRKGIEEIFSQLHRAQNSLDALISKNDRAATLEENSRRAQEDSPTAMQIRAKTLYAELVRALRCSEHACHQAGLELDYEVNPESNLLSRARFSEAYQRFRVLFDQSSGWRRGEIHVCRGDHLLPQNARPLRGTVVDTINEICPILMSVDHNAGLGFHLDLQPARLRGVYRQAQRVSRVQGTQEMPRSTITVELARETCPSLQALLDKSSHVDYDFALPARLALAVILTAWVQQLRVTGWLSDSWSKNSVLLVKNDVTRDAHVFNGFSPYLVRDFSVDSTQNAVPLHKRSIMLKLAVLLMELWFGATVESYEHMAGPHAARMSEGSCLNDWIEQKGAELPSRYLAAVKLCYALDQQPDDFVARELLNIEGDLANLHKISS